MKRFSETGKIHWTRYLSKPEIAHCPFQARENRCRKTTRHNSCPVLPDGTLLFASHRVETLIPGTAVSTAIRLLTITVCRVHGIIRFLTRRTPCIWLITLHAIQLSAAPPIPSMSSYARGHSTAWEQRQLGEVTEKVTEKNSGLAYQQVLTNSATHGIVRQSEYFDRIVASKNHLDAYYVVNPNDYVYNPRISKEAQCGPINRNTLELTGIASPLYLVFRVSPQSLAYEFLDQYFKTANWFNYMKLQGNSGARSDRFTIADSDFFSMPVRIPSLPEQHHIGEFFSTLDKLIAAAERQETLLRQKKQAYLQLMFPCEGETQPRLRFSGFSGDWEQRQSSELFVPVKENGHSDLPVLSATQSEGMVYRDDQSRDIKFKKDNLGSYKLVRAGDFVISLRSFQGGFELSDKTGIVSPAYTVFTHAECSSQDNGYWKQYFKRRSFIESLKTVTFGIRDGKAISFSDFSSLKCIFPTLPEQRLIGRFFSTLDSLIAAAEERTRALKEMKSAYLQRMFV